MTLTAADVVLAMAFSFAIGWEMRGLARERQRQNLAPYDRPGFPGPGLWGLLGWLATPVGIVVFCWRFRRRRWAVPALLGWWLGLMALGWLGDVISAATG